MRMTVSTLLIGVASVLSAPAGVASVLSTPDATQVQDVDIAVVTMDDDDGARWLRKTISERVREVEQRILSKDKNVRAIRVRPDDQYRGFNKDEGLDVPMSVETINGAVRVGREVTVLSGFSGRYRFVGNRIEVSVRRSWVDKWRKKKGMRYPFVVNAISEGRTFALDAPSVVQLNRAEETIKGRMAVMYVAPAASLDAAIARKGERKRHRARGDRPRPLFGAADPITVPDVAPARVAAYESVRTAPLIEGPVEAAPQIRTTSIRVSHVQLGSYPTAAAAKVAWKEMTKRHPGLSSLQRADRRAELNGRQVYRLRVATAGYDKAKEVCSRLKSAGEGCFIAS